MEQSKELEMMRQLIEKKKQKSASQTGIKHGHDKSYGGGTPGNKKQKKGGISPK